MTKVYVPQTSHGCLWSLDIDFRQIGRGALNATLSQTVGGSWSLSKARFDRPAYQQGAAIAGMRTFAILDPLAPEIEWCGRPFSPDTIAVFARDGEFQSISQPGFDVYTLSFTDEQLAAACERLGIPDVTEGFSAGGQVRQTDARQSNAVRQLVNSSLHALCGPGLQGSDWKSSDHIRDKVAEHLDSELTVTGRIALQDDLVTIDYIVEQENKDKWNAVIGGNWDINRNWSISMEYNGFFGSREAYIAAVTWRF